MKQYDYIKLVNSGWQIDKFETAVLTEIKAAQALGFEVDVTYNNDSGQFSALILGYKNV